MEKAANSRKVRQLYILAKKTTCRTHDVFEHIFSNKIVVRTR